MERIDYRYLAPTGVSMRGVQRYVDHCGLEKKLLELVKLRAWQINGCAYCIGMHNKDARVLGETEQRLYAVAAWPEAPFFSEQERAALAWTEAVTLISSRGVPDDVYQLARRHFSEGELVDLTMAIIAINGWNRLAVSLRAVAGTYPPPSATTVQEHEARLPRTGT